MIGALILGVVAGAIARLLIPNDALEGMRGPASWLLTIVLGLVGALVGYWIFRLIGIGDDKAFDLGGIIGGVIGSVVVLLIATFVMRKSRGSARTT